MYRTSHSTRILKDAESALFREGLGSLFDQTSGTIQVETGTKNLNAKTEPSPGAPTHAPTDPTSQKGAEP